MHFYECTFHFEQQHREKNMCCDRRSAFEHVREIARPLTDRWSNIDFHYCYTNCTAHRQTHTLLRTLKQPCSKHRSQRATVTLCFLPQWGNIYNNNNNGQTPSKLRGETKSENSTGFHVKFNAINLMCIDNEAENWRELFFCCIGLRLIFASCCFWPVAIAALVNL